MLSLSLHRISVVPLNLSIVSTVQDMLAGIRIMEWPLCWDLCLSAVIMIEYDTAVAFLDYYMEAGDNIPHIPKGRGAV